LKAQRVCRVKAIPVAARATRISALWLGVAALTLAVAALPAEAGKKQKPAKAPDESIVDVDNKQPMIVVVSIGQQKVDVYRGTSLVTTSAVSTGTSAHPTFIGAFSIMQKARWHHSNIYSGAPMPWMNRLTWSGTAMHAGIVPGYPASHGCIRLTYAFAPKFFQMSSVGDNVITSRGRPKPTPIEHGALFQPLPPPTLPMVERQTSISPLERVSAPIPAVAAASPVILAKAEMPTTVDSDARPQAKEDSTPQQAPSNEDPAKDANAEDANTENAGAETESDPNRVHAITPDMNKSQERLAAPDPAPAAASVEGKAAEKPVAAAPVAPQPATPDPVPAPVTPVTEVATAPDLPPPASAAKVNAGVDAAAIEAAEPRSGAPLRILLTRRTQRDRIIGMQEVFASLGYLPAQSFDGTMGKATITAIKEFQKANGMRETGAINDELVKKVYEVAGKGEPPAGHLYVRQNFDDVFDTAVGFRNAEEPLGTHVYVALNFAPGDTRTNWVTLDVQDGGGAAAPLDRLEIPEDVRQKISERLTPGSTFIVADTSINSAHLPRGGDFVVLAKSTGAKISMTDEVPEARPKPRRRNNAVVRRYYDDPWGGAPWSGRNRGLFGRGPW
jgi:peptidoglycan hydrolase-like protein with peptidoglycan-binding domain